MTTPDPSPPGTPPRGTLYVVATPIGNLGDLSPRAGEILRSVQAVVAEDTRRTRQLYSWMEAPSPVFLSLPAYDERARLGPILARLQAGEQLALCTDAGTPAISDPGQALVAAAWEVGARVVPNPGPCAAIAALVASGLPTDRFLVAGFLPRKGAGRELALEWMARLPVTLVLYEAGNRTAATLKELSEAFGARPAAVARELTKLYEEIARGTLAELAARFGGEEVRGEVTLVVGGAEGLVPVRPEPAEDLDAELARRLAAGEPSTEIARSVARERGLKRGDVYDQLERMKRG